MRDVVRVVQRRVTAGDPHVMTDDPDVHSIRNCLYEPLVRRNEALGFDPCLATSWRVSGDARTWWFTIRPRVQFHDGERLDADDVIASLERIRDGGVEGELGTTGVYQWYLAGSTFERLSSHEVRVSLAEPMADLLDLLVDIPVVSARSIEPASNRAAGSGEYVVEEASDGRVVLARSLDHWQRRDVPSRLAWQECPQAQERLERLLEGAADISCDLQRIDLGSLTDRPGLKLHHLRTPTCTVFMLNLRRGPCVSPSFRRRLAAAVDQDRLIDEVLGGAALPIYGPLTDMHLGFSPPSTGPGADEDVDARDGPTHITLNVPATTPDEAPMVARSLAAAYEAIGVRADVVVHEDRDDYASRVRAGDIGDAACFDSTPLSTFRVLNEKFHSKRGGPWWQGYSEPSVDEALDKARATPDLAQRRLLYQMAYRQISRDLPWLFLYNPLRYVGTGPRIRALQVTPEGYLDLAVPA